MGEHLLPGTVGPPPPPPSCPCCSFLPGGAGLFLPPDQRVGEEGEAEPGPPSLPDAIGPLEALKRMREAAAASSAASSAAAGGDGGGPVLLVDTHGHAHLDRERHACYVPSDEIHSDAGGGGGAPGVVSLTCAVSESDWDRALARASESDRILPGLGVHPWYLESLSDSYLSDLEGLLLRHPSAIVGEIGLCKVAKFVRTYPEGKAAAMALQRRAFREQLELAARLGRPATVHCVQQHGVLMTMLKEMREERARELAAEKSRRWKRRKEASAAGEGREGDDGEDSVGSLAGAFPPAVGMHSFTGTAHHVKEILKFEESLFSHGNAGGKADGSKEGRTHPPIFYFGFSHIVNVVMCSSDKSRRQNVEAIRAVPPDRLLAESDVHSPGDVPAATAGSAAYIAAATGWALGEAAERTARNGIEFLTAARRGRD